MLRHGTSTAYKRHGCRCDICRAAKYKEAKSSRLQRLRGVEHLVDVDPLRDHVATLVAAGMSIRAIALSAGWSHRNGLAAALKRPRVKPRTVARVLAVRLDCVDATGSRRRLEDIGGAS